MNRVCELGVWIGGGGVGVWCGCVQVTIFFGANNVPVHSPFLQVRISVFISIIVEHCFWGLLFHCLVAFSTKSGLTSSVDSQVSILPFLDGSLARAVSGESQPADM